MHGKMSLHDVQFEWASPGSISKSGKSHSGPLRAVVPQLEPHGYTLAFDDTAVTGGANESNGTRLAVIDGQEYALTPVKRGQRPASAGIREEDHNRQHLPKVVDTHHKVHGHHGEGNRQKKQGRPSSAGHHRKKEKTKGKRG